MTCHTDIIFIKQPYSRHGSDKYRMATHQPTLNKRQGFPKLVQCPVCHDELLDPRLLSCAKSSIEKYNYSREVPCPACQQVTVLSQGGADNLP